MKRFINIPPIALAALITLFVAVSACAEDGDQAISAERIDKSVEAVLQSFRERVADARKSGSEAQERAALIGLAASLEWANNMAVRKAPEIFLSEKVEVYDELISLEESLENSQEASRYRVKREALCSAWDLDGC